MNICYDARFGITSKWILFEDMKTILSKLGGKTHFLRNFHYSAFPYLNCNTLKGLILSNFALPM